MLIKGNQDQLTTRADFLVGLMFEIDNQISKYSN